MRRFLTAGAVVFLLTAMSPTGAAASGWSVQPTPNPSSIENQLQDVSCSSPTACTAVGYQYDQTGAVIATLAERWNGTKWSTQATPTKKPAPGNGPIVNGLGGVDCISRGDCVAVGDFGLIVRWNGTQWSTQPTPDPKHNQYRYLHGVSCASANACTAVGSGEGLSNGGPFPTYGTLAERWNGIKWSIQPIPNPTTPSGRPQLNGVSCPSVSSCIAVGYTHNEANNSFQVLVERWNGTKWSIQQAPNSPDVDTALYRVSCPSVSLCMAVGEYGAIGGGPGSTSPFAERWNGTKWSIQYPTASPDSLYGVSCPSKNLCTAVGGAAGSASGLAERWNGTKWSIQPTPKPGTSQANTLWGVSCASPSACTAVGDTNGSSKVTLAESWTG